MEHTVPKREKKNSYNILVGKPEGERLIESSKRRWKDNIKNTSSKHMM
jgi:hypothetical protein